ncbi:unnamed protein product, partial [Symbiodinium microadriaticum]
MEGDDREILERMTWRVTLGIAQERWFPETPWESRLSESFESAKAEMSDVCSRLLEEDARWAYEKDVKARAEAARKDDKSKAEAEKKDDEPNAEGSKKDDNPEKRRKTGSTFNDILGYGAFSADSESRYFQMSRASTYDACQGKEMGTAFPQSLLVRVLLEAALVPATLLLHVQHGMQNGDFYRDQDGLFSFTWPAQPLTDVVRTLFAFSTYKSLRWSLCSVVENRNPVELKAHFVQPGIIPLISVAATCKLCLRCVAQGLERWWRLSTCNWDWYLDRFPRRQRDYFRAHLAHAPLIYLVAGAPRGLQAVMGGRSLEHSGVQSLCDPNWEAGYVHWESEAVKSHFCNACLL